MIGIRCPHCKQVLVFRELEPGDARKCPKCGEWFALPSEGAGPRLCPRCKAEAPPEADSCAQCGYGKAEGEALPLPRADVIDEVQPVPKKRRWLRKAAAVAVILLALAALYAYRRPLARWFRRAAQSSGLPGLEEGWRGEGGEPQEGEIEGLQLPAPPEPEP